MVSRLIGWARFMVYLQWFLLLHPKRIENMKKIALAAALSVAASTAFAGNPLPPMMDEVVVVEETTSSSAGGMILPLMLLLVVAAAASS